jgi:hypothetical protein
MKNKEIGWDKGAHKWKRDRLEREIYYRFAGEGFCRRTEESLAGGSTHYLHQITEFKLHIWKGRAE